MIASTLTWTQNKCSLLPPSLWHSICSHYNSIINMYNYCVFEATKRSLISSFSLDRRRLIPSHERAYTKQWQFNMAHQQISTQQKQSTRQVKISAKICDGFLDIIPLCIVSSAPAEWRFTNHIHRCQSTRWPHARICKSFVLHHGTSPTGGSR